MIESAAKRTEILTGSPFGCTSHNLLLWGHHWSTMEAKSLHSESQPLSLIAISLQQRYGRNQPLIRVLCPIPEYNKYTNSSCTHQSHLDSLWLHCRLEMSPHRSSLCIEIDLQNTFRNLSRLLLLSSQHQHRRPTQPWCMSHCCIWIVPAGILKNTHLLDNDHHSWTLANESSQWYFGTAFPVNHSPQPISSVWSGQSATPSHW